MHIRNQSINHNQQPIEINFHLFNDNTEPIWGSTATSFPHPIMVLHLPLLLLISYQFTSLGSNLWDFWPERVSSPFSHSPEREANRNLTTSKAIWPNLYYILPRNLFFPFTWDRSVPVQVASATYYSTMILITNISLQNLFTMERREGLKCSSLSSMIGFFAFGWLVKTDPGPYPFIHSPGL